MIITQFFGQVVVSMVKFVGRLNLINHSHKILNKQPIIKKKNLAIEILNVLRNQTFHCNLACTEEKESGTKSKEDRIRDRNNDKWLSS
jgi:hypothetical protein